MNTSIAPKGNARWIPAFAGMTRLCEDKEPQDKKACGLCPALSSRHSGDLSRRSPVGA